MHLHLKEGVGEEERMSERSRVDRREGRHSSESRCIWCNDGRDICGGKGYSIPSLFYVLLWRMLHLL